MSENKTEQNENKVGEEKKQFVTIELSRKQVDFDHPRVSEKNGNISYRVFAPNGGSYYLPESSLHDVPNNKDRVKFTRPDNVEVTIYRSVRNEGVPEEAPNNEKFSTVKETITFGELYQQYEQKREEFRAQKQDDRSSEFMKFSVPFEWTSLFTGKNNMTEYRSVSLPIKEEGAYHYYSFIVKADNVRVDEKSNECQFSLPIHRQGEPENEYMVTLNRSVKQDDGSYQKISKEMATSELSGHVEAAKKSYALSKEMVQIYVSENMVREFSTKDNTRQFYAVLVPVFENGKDVLYEIVVPEYRIDKNRGGEGKFLLKLPGNNDFTLEGRHNFKDEGTGEYAYTTVKLTSKEISECFKESASRYRERMDAERSEQAGEAKENEEEYHAQAGRRH